MAVVVVVAGTAVLSQGGGVALLNALTGSGPEGESESTLEPAGTQPPLQVSDAGPSTDVVDEPMQEEDEVPADEVPEEEGTSEEPTYVTIERGSGVYTPPAEPSAERSSGPPAIAGNLSEPQNLVAVPGPGPGQVTITWEPPALGADTVVAYVVYRDVTFLGLGSQVGSTTSLSHVDTTPAPGATYYYFVTSFSNYGSSAPAGPAMAVSYPAEATLPVPELPSLVLAGLGLALVAFVARRR